MSTLRSQSALLILGHGSTENPDSSQPTWDLADKIHDSGEFSSVHCAFWKEEPSFRQIFASIDEDLIFAVPNFISEGYFTREVLPRELELDGTTTRRGDKTVFYCDPVGIHPTMTKLLARRAVEILDDRARPQDSALIIVGHGTNLNKKSTEAITNQVEALRDENLPFAQILDAYMEEPPFIADWREMTDATNVVVVPFFIADGLHSFQDIPVLLGIESEPTAAASQLSVFRENPIERDGRRLFYSRAIGTAPQMSEVILDQVTHFEKHYLHASA